MKIDWESLAYIVLILCFFGLMTVIVCCSKDEDKTTDRLDRIERRLDALEGGK